MKTQVFISGNVVITVVIDKNFRGYCHYVYGDQPSTAVSREDACKAFDEYEIAIYDFCRANQSNLWSY